MAFEVWNRIIAAYYIFFVGHSLFAFVLNQLLSIYFHILVDHCMSEVGRRTSDGFKPPQYKEKKRVLYKNKLKYEFSCCITKFKSKLKMDAIIQFIIFQKCPLSTEIGLSPDPFC